MYTYYVKGVPSVIDGDTIDVVIDLGFDISFSARVRMAGIDAPESRTKDLSEKALGVQSKEYLASRLKGAKEIIIKTELSDSAEKFGRVLGWVYTDDSPESINTRMILDGYAWKYDGGTKIKDFALLKKLRMASGK